MQRSGLRRLRTAYARATQTHPHARARAHTHTRPPPPCKRAAADALHDDLGEGIDALLSLASIAHAAQSGAHHGDFSYGDGDYDDGAAAAARMARTPRKPVPGDMPRGWVGSRAWEDGPAGG